MSVPGQKVRVNGRLIEIGLGHFRVSPKPRGGDWLEVDIQALKREGFTFVVSLLTDPEMEELCLTEEGATCRRNGIEFYSFPIVDRSTPSSREDFEALAARLLRKIEEGERGIFHCRAGLGRAPLLGCAIMQKAGTSPEEGWRMLCESRGQPVPDTEAQKAWVANSEPSFNDLDDAFSKLLEDSL